MRLYKSLKFQITAALLLILALFGSLVALTMPAVDEQRAFNTLLNITARLQHVDQGLVELAINYAGNSPPDDAAYQRDLKLYYREIRKQINLFDEIQDAFMRGTFDTSLTDRAQDFRPDMNPAIKQAVMSVEEAWSEFKAGLEQTLGMEEHGPRLLEAAKYITLNQFPLGEAIDVLRSQIQRVASDHLDQVNRIYWLALIVVTAVTLGILIWFYYSVLRPLSRAVKGFRVAAQGDFGFRVPLAGSDELASLTSSFNLMSSRLHAIFQLIDRIQQGSDLNDTLCFVAEQFPQLLPLDWVGALFVSGDGTLITLEKSYRGGSPELSQKKRFRLRNTLLLKALETDQPLHIPDMKETAADHPEYEFLNHMVERGLRDAIFLPISDQSPIPGVLAFATDHPGLYTREHLELISNIAKLVTHSFGRTVKLSEHARLAAIGGFASGIAHEIRSPLSTIGMALDYMQRSQQEPPAEKRLALARQETARLTRLLEEMLLYAKPLELSLGSVEMTAFVREFLNGRAEIAAQRQQRHELRAGERPLSVSADSDRLQQVLLNIHNNAAEASPDAAVIVWRLACDEALGMLTLEVTNPGTPIPAEIAGRLFEPFFTTKSSGTGLGLGIVKRIVEAHGGEISISPAATEGNRVSVQIPLS
ncbi:MAG: HAMP domain-containing protein [Gammaproteobacteria bacterium]|nr:HAMP domain-containing protein [Gammaproteobacteria bacterium]